MLTSPTQWQASTFLKIYKSKLKLMREGTNTGAMFPDSQEPLVLHGMGEKNSMILSDETSHQSCRHEAHAGGSPGKL